MINSEYADFVSTLFNHQTTLIDNDLNHAFYGMVNEIGELGGALKKRIGYNREIDWENVLEEVGDLMFYVTAFCRVKGWDVEYVMERNMEKLRRRYPEGYTDECAVERKDKADGKTV